MLMNLLINFFNSFKNLYGKFWTLPEGHKEYYLKIDSYYYCHKKNKFFVVIRIRNKRTIDVMPIEHIINDKEYLRELHPIDACVIGILASNENNELINKNNTKHQIKKIKEYECFVKSDPILYVIKKHINHDGLEITTLKARYLEKEIEIPTRDLCKNQALLYALDVFQAISVGYSAGESHIKNAT